MSCCRVGVREGGGDCVRMLNPVPCMQSSSSKPAMRSKASHVFILCNTINFASVDGSGGDGL